MRWLNYQHFFYFWNVARFGSVTEASQHLRLAQPTISAQLKSFEEVIGEKLFQRVGRKIQLTDTGYLAYKYAEQVFGLGQEFLDVLDGKAESTVKAFTVGISDVVPKSLAYRLIEPALGSELASTLICYEDNTERLLASLAIAEIDLVIADRPIPPTVKVKAFNHFIGECGVSFLASPIVAKRYKKNFPRSLSDAPMLLPTSESAVRHELDRWFDTINVSPSCIGAFQDRALIKIAARQGKGIIPVPTVIEEEVMNEFHLVCMGRTDKVKEQLYAISLERRLKTPLIVLICSQGKEVLYR